MLILISCESKYGDYVPEDETEDVEGRKYKPILTKELVDKKLIASLELKKVGASIITIADLEDKQKREDLYINTLENVHISLIKQIGEVYLEEESDRQLLLENYYNKQAIINEKHYEVFASRVAAEVDFTGKELTSSETYKTTSIFSDVTSQLICFVLDEIVPLPIRSGRKPGNGIKDILESGLCVTAFGAMLEPLDQYFEEYAIIHSVNDLLITEHRRENIMQMATAEDIFAVDIRETFNREYFFGLFDSEAELKLNMSGKFKAGFDLNEYFQMIFNYETKVIEIYLPEPKILTSETDFEIKNIDNGLVMQIGEDEINRTMNNTKTKLYNLANESGLIDKAKVNMEQTMRMLVSPSMVSLEREYEIRLHFGISPEFHNSTVNNYLN